MLRTSHRTSRRAALALTGTVAASLTLAACASDGGGTGGGGDDGETTTGKRVELEVVVQRTGQLDFTNEEGWEIRLSRALVSVGPLYFFEGEPIESATDALLVPPSRALPRDLARPRDLWDRAGELLLGTAHAHPGHYVEGEARGEMLTPTSVDLAAQPLSIGLGQGITGLVRSARFGWTSPAQGPFASDLGALVVVLEGRAKKGDEERWFRLEATRDEALDAAGELRVDGCVFDAFEVTGNGYVTLGIDPSVWLAGSDFTDAPAGAAGTNELVPVGTQPFNAFERGLKKGGAYHFFFTAK